MVSLLDPRKTRWVHLLVVARNGAAEWVLERPSTREG